MLVTLNWICSFKADSSQMFAFHSKSCLFIWHRWCWAVLLCAEKQSNKGTEMRCAACGRGLVGLVLSCRAGLNSKEGVRCVLWGMGWGVFCVFCLVVVVVFFFLFFVICFGGFIDLYFFNLRKLRIVNSHYYPLLATGESVGVVLFLVFFFLFGMFTQKIFGV